MATIKSKFFEKKTKFLISIVVISAFYTSQSNACFINHSLGHSGDSKEVYSTIIQEYQSVLNKIPRLSPSEEIWLDKELNSTDSARLLNAWDSVEYHRRRVIDFFSSILKSIETAKQIRSYRQQSWISPEDYEYKSLQEIEYLTIAAINTSEVNLGNDLRGLAKIGMIDSSYHSAHQICQITTNGLIREAHNVTKILLAR